MQVGLITPAFPHPHGGLYVGVERHSLDLARQLVGHGHTVVVYTTFWNGGIGVEEYNGISIRRSTDLSRTLGKLGSILDLHYFTWGHGLLGHIDSLQECDVIHGLSPLSSSRQLASLGLPLVTQFYHHEGIRRAADLLYKPVHQWIEWSTYRNSSLVIAPSESSGEDLRRRCRVPPEKVRLVPLAIDLDWHSSTLGRGSSSSVRILFVGPHEPRKELVNLLRALAILRSAGMNAVLTTVGRGPMMAELRDLANRLGISDAVEFKGYLHPDSAGLPRMYGEADLFAFPSRLEGFGLALLEAMASGLPIVACDASAIPEVVGDCGILVPPGDVDALSDALGLLIANPSLRKEMGEKGRKRVEARYTWKQVLPQVVAVYEEAMEMNPQRRS